VRTLERDKREERRGKRIPRLLGTSVMRECIIGPFVRVSASSTWKEREKNSMPSAYDHKGKEASLRFGNSKNDPSWWGEKEEKAFFS